MFLLIVLAELYVGVITEIFTSLISEMRIWIQNHLKWLYLRRNLTVIYESIENFNKT